MPSSQETCSLLSEADTEACENTELPKAPLPMIRMEVDFSTLIEGFVCLSLENGMIIMIRLEELRDHENDFVCRL